MLSSYNDRALQNTGVAKQAKELLDYKQRIEGDSSANSDAKSPNTNMQIRGSIFELADVVGTGTCQYCARDNAVYERA